MAIMMRMDWHGVTVEQYDALREAVGWERDKPTGSRFHVAAVDESGAHVSDVWESADDFQKFVDERLMPGVRQVGISGAPEVTMYDAHAVFASGYE